MGPGDGDVEELEKVTLRGGEGIEVGAVAGVGQAETLKCGEY